MSQPLYFQKLLALTGYETRWAPDLVWIWWWNEKFPFLLRNETPVIHFIVSHSVGCRICLQMMGKWKLPVSAGNQTLVTHVIASYWLNSRICLQLMVKGKIPVPAGNQTPVIHLKATHWLGPRIGLHMMKWKIPVPACFFLWWFLVCPNNYIGLSHITNTNSEWQIGKAAIMTHFKTISTFSWRRWGKFHEITSISIQDSKWLHPNWEWWT